MAKTLSIGGLGRATGTKAETIRYYERIGLLPRTGRTAGNYRVYAPSHVERMNFIRRARGLGFSLDQVRSLLSVADNPSQPCESVDAIAQHHLQEVDRKIADLDALRTELRQLLEQCRHGTVADCRILEALGRSTSS